MSRVYPHDSGWGASDRILAFIVPNPPAEDEYGGKRTVWLLDDQVTSVCNLEI